MVRLLSPQVPKIISQRGVISPIVIAVVILILIAGIYLLNQKSNKIQTDSTEKETSKQTQEEQSKEKIKDVPDPVNEFLNKFDIEKYEKAGIKVYKGDNPPNIEGSYYFNSLVLFYDEPWDEQGEIGDGIVNYNYKFYDQKSDGTINSSYTAESAPSEAVGIGAFISGNENCFTIFVDDKGRGFSCNTREARLISACKTDKGLEQVKDSFIMKEKEGSDCNELMPVGNLRIITEDDGLADLIKK